MLDVKKWGYSNPVIAPLYCSPPIYWVDARIQVVVYETDMENVERVIPYPLEPRDNRVIAWVSELPFTTQGNYNEAALYVMVKYKNYVGTYEPFLYVNTEIPLAGGREIWGFCKKLANISVNFEKEIVRGEVERAKIKIMTCLSTCELPANLEEVPLGPVFSLKLIPPASPEEPPLKQLIFTEAKLTAQKGRFFKGVGSVEFEKSEVDPLYILQPKKIIGGYYGIFDMVLPHGKIVYRYEKE